MSTVDIAMATYNGELYLAQQIDSIIAQTVTDWRLFVRDDGSSDNTVAILREYAARDSRIQLIEDGLGRLGVSRNFEEALCRCTAPYTMFADQDDVWFEDKIGASLRLIGEYDQQEPLLLFTNSIMTNSDLSVRLGMLYRPDEPHRLCNFLFANAGYQGASLMFNKALRELALPFMSNSNVHDYHICLIGFFYGQILFLKEPQLYYRRHATTTTLNNKTFGARVAGFFKGVPMVYDKRMRDYLIALYDSHKDRIRQEDKRILDAYLKITDRATGKIKRMAIARRHGFTLRGSRHYLLLKLLLLKR